MIRDARPYLVPGPGAVTWAGWHRSEGDEWVPLGGEVEGWDPETDLVIRRDVEADWAEFRRDAGLPPDFPLVITARWESSSSQMRARLGSTSVPLAGPAVVQGVVPGGLAGGVLEISTSISTAADWPTAPPAVAARAGSVFVTDSVRVTLEGSGSMFPVALVDFARTRFDPDASWHLAIPNDLSAPFLGSVLLSVNERDRELVEAITAARPSPAQRALVEEVQQRVAIAMLETALDADDLLEASWPAESAGDVLRHLLVAAGEPVPRERADRRSWLDGATRRAANGRSFT